MDLKSLNLNLYFKEAALFGLTQAIGLWTAVTAKSALKEMQIAVTPTPWWAFLIYFAVATVAILLVLRFSKRGPFLKIFFGLSLFAGMQVIAGLLLPPIPSILIPLALVAFYYLNPFVWLHNFILITSIAGIGGFLGLSLNPRGVIIILALLAVYDYWAVYKTRHMIRMAKEFIKESIIPAIVLPQERTGFGKRVREAKPHEGFYLLGSGDLVFPLILASSSLSIGLFNAVFVSVFSLLGLFITHFIFVFQEKRAPMPALPPIAAMSILGLWISLFFK